MARDGSVESGLSVTQDVVGCAVAPTIRMRRLLCSITARTYIRVPDRGTVSSQSRPGGCRLGSAGSRPTCWSSRRSPDRRRHPSGSSRRSTRPPSLPARAARDEGAWQGHDVSAAPCQDARATAPAAEPATAAGAAAPPGTPRLPGANRTRSPPSWRSSPRYARAPTRATDRQSGCRPPARADDILGMRSLGLACVVAAGHGAQPSGLRVDLGDQGFDVLVDLVADGADGLDALARRLFEGQSRHFLPGKTGPRVPLREFVMPAPAASLPIPVLSKTLDTSLTAAFQWTRRLLAAGTPTYGESCG